MKGLYLRVGGLLLLYGVCGCSGLERSEEEKVRRANLKAEPILRQEHEELFVITPPVARARELYSFEKEDQVISSSKE